MCRQLTVEEGKIELRKVIDGGYNICSRYIIDTTDPDIQFDDNGVCSHCHHYESIVQGESYLKKREDGALDCIVAEIKEKGARKK